MNSDDKRKPCEEEVETHVYEMETYQQHLTQSESL